MRCHAEEAREQDLAHVHYVCRLLLQEESYAIKWVLL